MLESLHMRLPLIEPLRRYAQFVRFLIAGGTAFLSNILALYLIADVLGVWYLRASVCAFVVAFLVSFSLQKFWTFKDKEVSRVHAQLGVSLMVAFINLGINTLLMYLLVEWGGLHHLPAQVIATGIIAIETYFVYKYVIFAARKAAPQLP